MVKKIMKNELANGLLGVLVGAAIVFVFFAYFGMPYNNFGPGTIQQNSWTPNKMAGTNNMMSNMMMRGMMGNNMMYGAHTDADADGKCDMCGMSIEMCRGMME